MKRKFSLKNFTPIMAIALVGVLALVVTASAVGYDKIFNITNYYEAGQTGDSLGGQIHNVLESFDAGIAVNGTEIINSSGAITGSSILTIAGESQLQRVVNGGVVLASSTTKALTLTAAQACDDSVIALSGVGADSFAITLPATSTLAADCLNTVGDTLSLIYMNTSTAVGTTTTITTNTDYQLLSDDANGDIIAGQDSAIITITRLATEMIATVNPFTSAE